MSFFVGIFMASDTVPLLGWLDAVKGYVKEMKKTAGELDCVSIGGSEEELKRKSWTSSML